MGACAEGNRHRCPTAPFRHPEVADREGRSARRVLRHARRQAGLPASGSATPTFPEPRIPGCSSGAALRAKCPRGVASTPVTAARPRWNRPSRPHHASLFIPAANTAPGTFGTLSVPQPGRVSRPRRRSSARRLHFGQEPGPFSGPRSPGARRRPSPSPEAPRSHAPSPAPRGPCSAAGRSASPPSHGSFLRPSGTPCGSAC